MEPRLSTSRKWSPLPAELIQQIQSVFKQSFATEMGKGTVVASGKIFPGEILIQVGFREGKSLKQINFLVSIAYQRNKDNVLKLLHLAVDAQASLFEQYFAAEDDSEFPRLWEKVDFETREIYVQYSTVNSELETEADKLLTQSGLDAEKVAQGDWDDDVDPEIIKAQLGLDGEEIGDELDDETGEDDESKH